LLTIVDDRTGEAHAECTLAHLLLGAIHKEYDLASEPASIEKATQIALGNKTHVFHFSKQAALDNLQEYSAACALVRQGKSVYLTDRPAMIRTDP
jgi:hypothetical protein